MNDWRGGWRIAKHELWRDRMGLMFTFIFTVYLTAVTFPLTKALFAGQPDESWTCAIDFMMLSVLPSMGFMVSGFTMKYWKDDSFTRKLALWRTMPISIPQIVTGRLLLLFVVMIPILFIYFISQYVIALAIGQALPLYPLILYALFWSGYSIALAIQYVYWEQSVSGKTYFLICSVYLVIIAVLVAVLWFSGIGLTRHLTASVSRGEWWYPGSALAAAALSVMFGSRLIAGSIRKRDLLG